MFILHFLVFPDNRFFRAFLNANSAAFAIETVPSIVTCILRIGMITDIRTHYVAQAAFYAFFSAGERDTAAAPVSGVIGGRAARLGNRAPQGKFFPGMQSFFGHNLLLTL
jgi:hypothetical protein